MADDPIAAARAARDNADRVLATHNAGVLKQARNAINGLQQRAAHLRDLAGQLDDGNARQSIGHLVSMVAAVEIAVQSELDNHARTLARLAADEGT